MKLIHILALATAMATMANAQTTGAGNANSGGQQPAAKAPSATPTPPTKGSPATKQAVGAKKKSLAGAAETTTGVPNSKKNAAGTSTPGQTATGTVVSSKKGGATSAVGIQQPQAAGAAAGASKTGASPAAKKSLVAPSAAPGKVPVTAGAVASKKGGTTKKGAKTQAVGQAKPAAKATKAAAKPPVKTPVAAPTPAPAAAVVAKPRIGALGRRDPFVSPIRLAGSNGPGANCTGGKRCLSIPELVLAGTVKDISGKMMAVVVTGAKKTYTLREKDQVFNGSVEKITTDSVIFREFVKDAVGRESAREVVKKVNPGPTS